MVSTTSLNHAQFIWSAADLLRGSYKSHEFGDVILPFTVLRRLDSGDDPEDVTPGMLRARAGHTDSFWNVSR